MTEKFLRRSQIEDITGLARSTIYEHMKAGKFPKPVKIGDRAVAWLQSDIQAWQDELIKKAQRS